MRYFIGVLVLLFFVIVGSILFIGRDKTAKVAIVSNDASVVDYVNSPQSKVVWERQGKLVGDNERFSVRVSVSQSYRTIEVLQGYDEKVVKSKTYSNGLAGYRTFLKALDNLGFGEARDRTIKDEEGACPTGNRYIYEIFDGSQTELRTWSTSCTKNDGTFDGRSAGVIRKLFQEQITDYNDIIRGYRI